MSYSNVSVINMMRVMRTARIDLEAVHRLHGGTLYRGRPEMLVLRLSNGRNIQLFRKGTLQILGRLDDNEAEAMRQEMSRLLPHPITPLQTRNIVASVQLKNPLPRPTMSNAHVFMELELFPAALIRKWHPAHVAVFHNGKVIVTGIQTMTDFYTTLSHLLDFLQNKNT